MVIKRPKLHDVDKMEVAEHIFSLIHGLSYLPNEEKKQHIKDIYEVSYLSDGYSIAKELELKGWAIDMELIGLLDNINCIRHTHHKKNITKWVKEQGIVSKFKRRGTVKFSSRKKEYTGVITDTYKNTAQYIICCEEMGHKEATVGKINGIYINFEDVIETVE